MYQSGIIADTFSSTLLLTLHYALLVVLPRKTYILKFVIFYLITNYKIYYKFIALWFFFIIIRTFH